MTYENTWPTAERIRDALSPPFIRKTAEIVSAAIDGNVTFSQAEQLLAARKNCPSIIATKRQMYRAMTEGRFGNCMPVYTTLVAAMASPHDWIGVRSLNVGDPVRLYHVWRPTLQVALAAKNAHRRTDLIFSQADNPDCERKIQGELTRNHLGLHFKYTHRQEAMRIALELDSHWASGFVAKRLLERYVDPAGIDNLKELLDKWPDHVIEFTEYAVPVGTHPATTLIWEVRRY